MKSVSYYWLPSNLYCYKIPTHFSSENIRRRHYLLWDSSPQRDFRAIPISTEGVRRLQLELHPESHAYQNQVTNAPWTERRVQNPTETSRFTVTISVHLAGIRVALRQINKEQESAAASRCRMPTGRLWTLGFEHATFGLRDKHPHP